MWVTPSAQTLLSSRDLGLILAGYRTITGTSQQQLGELLGFDQAYVSRLERGERRIRDIRALARVAEQLGIPPQVLGLASDDGADFAAMLQFADSTLRLAEVARQTGRAVEAVRELGPLVARLEARLAEGRADREVLVLLANARLSLGTALGHVLPEERLAVAARWTGRAFTLARRLGDEALEAGSLRMHGNELRKTGHVAAGIGRLARSLTLTSDPSLRGTTLGLLARAAAEHGDAELFDAAISETLRLLDQTSGHSMLFNPFSIREIHMRGLLATRRAEVAATLADDPGHQAGLLGVAPQWRIIDLITVADVLHARGEDQGALERLSEALREAEAYRLPHQVQRALRLLGRIPGDTARTLSGTATTVLDRLRRQLSTPATT